MRRAPTGSISTLRARKVTSSTPATKWVRTPLRLRSWKMLPVVRVDAAALPSSTSCWAPSPAVMSSLLRTSTSPLPAASMILVLPSASIFVSPIKVIRS